MIEDFDLNAPSPDSVWARARSDYAAGESASAVCERYRLTRSTFFARAKAEGWRRSDGLADGSSAGGLDPYVAEMEAALVFELMGRPATPAYTLARRAWAMAEIALLQRRRIEAQSWIRIARDLRKLALEEHATITWRRAEQLGEAAMPARRASPPLQSEGDGCEADAGGDAAAGVAETSQATPAPTASPAAPPAPQAAPAPCGAGEEPAPEEPDWGPLPLSVLASPKKLDAFLKGEFADAWAALDSSDRSDRTVDSASRNSSSPSLGEVAVKPTEGPREAAE